MKLTGYLLAILGLIIIVQTCIFTFLGWDSQYWEKYPIKYLSIGVNARTVGSAHTLSGVEYYVEANYQFILDGNVKYGRTVTFGKNKFADEASAITYMNYVKKSDFVYYNKIFDLSCLKNDVSNPTIPMIVGVFLALISIIFFRKRKR